jgi:hypothetical protein
MGTYDSGLVSVATVPANIAENLPENIGYQISMTSVP